jgi:hypothetical protein
MSPQLICRQVFLVHLSTAHKNAVKVLQHHPFARLHLRDDLPVGFAEAVGA